MTYTPGQEQGERWAQDGEQKPRADTEGHWRGETARAAREEGWGTLSTKLVLELVLCGSDNNHKIINVHIPAFTNEEEVESCEGLTFCLQPVARNYWSQDLNPSCDTKPTFSLLHWPLS